MRSKTLATIAVEGGRGNIFAIDEPAAYYSDLMEEDGIEWLIRVELPNGQVEVPAIAPQRTMDDVIEAISQSWGLGDWDLQFVED